jgi:hypothetical protein
MSLPAQFIYELYSLAFTSAVSEYQSILLVVLPSGRSSLPVRIFKKNRLGLGCEPHLARSGVFVSVRPSILH